MLMQVPFLRFETFVSLIAREDDGFRNTPSRFNWGHVVCISLRTCILVGFDGVAISPGKLIDFFFQMTGRSLWIDLAWIEAHRLEQRRRGGAGLHRTPARTDWFNPNWAQELVSEFPAFFPPFVWPGGTNGQVIRANFVAGGRTPSSSVALAEAGMRLDPAFPTFPITPPNTPTRSATPELLELRDFRGLPPAECSSVEDDLLLLRELARLAPNQDLCFFGLDVIPTGFFSRAADAQREGILHWPGRQFLDAEIVQLFPATSLFDGVPEVRYESISGLSSNFNDPAVGRLVLFNPGVFIASTSAIIAANDVLADRAFHLDITEGRRDPTTFQMLSHGQAAPNPPPAVSSSSSPLAELRHSAAFIASLSAQELRVALATSPVSPAVTPTYSPISPIPSSPEPPLYTPPSDGSAIPASTENGHYTPPALAARVTSESSVDPEYSPPLPANGQ
jgi:hypothetical protein